MGHIFYVMGKSASGKDTIYKILRERLPQIRTVVPYTTRPIRAGERDGVEYYFVTGKRLADLEKQGKIIEKRNLPDYLWTVELCNGGRWADRSGIA